MMNSKRRIKIVQKILNQCGLTFQSLDSGYLENEKNKIKTKSI